MEKCVFCNEELGEDPSLLVTIQGKGAKGVNTASKDRGCSFKITPGQTVNIQCRMEYIKPQNVIKDIKALSVSEGLALRSAETFDFKTQCLLCGQPAKYDSKSRKRAADVYPVRPQ